jgi:hypothetical protein
MLDLAEMGKNYNALAYSARDTKMKKKNKRLISYRQIQVKREPDDEGDTW